MKTHTDTLREIRALGFLDQSQRAIKARELSTDAERLTRYARALRLSQRLSNGQLLARFATALVWLGVLLCLELIWHAKDYSDAALIVLLVISAASIACGALHEASDS